jgi:metal-responsive CopG/Arc/MetJ family transcriptional regulator
MTLPVDLVERLHAVAERQKLSVSELCEAWIRAALSEMDEAASSEVPAVGRCSVRTQHASEGPVPLPLQQGTNA